MHYLTVCERVEILPVLLDEVLHLAAQDPVEVLGVVSVGGVGDNEQGPVRQNQLTSRSERIIDK